MRIFIQIDFNFIANIDRFRLLQLMQQDIFQFDAGDRCVGAGSSTGYYGNPVGLRLPIILTDKPVCAALLT